jgi:hypothetical protein
VVRASGSLGQYDIVADGEVVATRKRGLAAILGGGWPDAAQVMKALLDRQAGRTGSSA